MPVTAVGSVIPRHSRVLTKKAEQVLKNEESGKVINSFEFHAGFIPSHKEVGFNKINQTKVQHFIDSIV